MVWGPVVWGFQDRLMKGWKAFIGATPNSRDPSPTNSPIAGFSWRTQTKLHCGWTNPSGQSIIFHQPRFPWKKGIPLTKPPFGVRSCRYNLTRPIWNIFVKLERISPGCEENTRTKLTPTNTPVLLETGKQNKKGSHDSFSKNSPVR